MLLKTTTFLYTIAFIVLGITIAIAQENYRVVHWGTDQGMSKPTWHSGIQKDKNGFIWFGSPHGELCRFDGNQFKQYYGLYVSNFYEDSEHAIWVASHQGIFRIDKKVQSPIQIVPNKSVHTTQVHMPLGEIGDTLYFIDSTVYISALNKKTHTVHRLCTIPIEKLKFSGLTSAFYDRRTKSVWFLLDETEGLLQVSLRDYSQTFHMRKIQYPVSFYHDSEAMKYDSSRHCIWINAHDGLWKFSIDDLQYQSSPVCLGMIHHKDYHRQVGIDIDPSGRIWFAVLPMGIMVYDPKVDRLFRPVKDSATSAFITDGNLKVYCDPDGMVWMSSWQAKGIVQLIPERKPLVRSLYAIDSKGKAQINFNAGIILKGNSHFLLGILNPPKLIEWGAESNASGKDYKLDEFTGISKQSNIIPIWLDDPHHLMWVGDQLNQVYRVDLNTKNADKVLLLDSSRQILKPGNTIYEFPTAFKDGFLLFDQPGGLFYLHRDSTNAYRIYHGVPVIFKAVPIGDTLLYLLTPPHSTVLALRNSKWIEIENPINSLGWNDITLDPADTSFWIANNDKIIQMNQHYKIVNEYQSDQLQGIIDLIHDRLGNIWFNSDKGVIGYINKKSGTVTLLTKEDGFEKQFWNHYPPHAISMEGHPIFVGKALGENPRVQIMLPENISEAPGVPCYISNAKIKNMDSLVFNMDSLYHLNYDQNSIDLTIGSIDFNSEGNNVIRYKMEGVNTDWQYQHTNSSIRYEQLRPNHYILTIQSSNSNKVFNGPAKIIHFYISPPFWETSWFRILSVMALALGVWSYTRYRSVDLIKKNILLDEKVKLRTNELNQSLADLKQTQTQLIQSEKMASLGELTAGIAHEIQNPLNFVNNFSLLSEDLVNELDDEINQKHFEDAKSISNVLKLNLQKINHHGKRAANIVTGMLEHSRTGSAEKRLVDINVLCDEYLRLSYHGLRAKNNSFNCFYSLDRDPALPLIYISPQEIGRVLLNILNNAFYAVDEKKREHSQKNEFHPEVILSTQQITRNDKSFVKIAIRDNGHGIPDSIKNKIFQPFFTTKPTGEGTGLGLSLSYDIITKGYGGFISVDSNTVEPSFTEFNIELPVA